ncbi:NAD(P)H-quinone oxidoreductase [Alkalilacustris brevis]|uniref:NAD(P)H-quinone oxidoreductase n=1 Tax=Alkalilacustris brevis TaxID=2026338 RepID=UPI00192E6159|nr:NAD(P)H-quinone oxidoreductase [Alkalilacustris brevis]
MPECAGGPEVLRVQERPIPEPQPGQVLIRVQAAGINRHDINQRTRGHGPAGSTDILGLEVAGEVVAIGAGVDAALQGRKVAALTDGGGYADNALAEAALLLDWPEGLSAIEAAALPEALFTLQLNLVELGRLGTGDWLLIHGGTSGIGMAGIRFAALRGARTLVTAGTDAKCARATEHGAHSAINYRNADFVAAVKDITGGHGTDMILDTVGGQYAARNIEALAPDGRLVHLSPAPPEFCVPLGALMAKRARVSGALLRALPLSRKTALAEAIRADVWPHVSTTLRPVIDRVFPLEDAAEAHRHMDSGTHMGKIVLSTG